MRFSLRTLATTEWLMEPSAHAVLVAKSTATASKADGSPDAFFFEESPPLTPEQRAALLPKVEKWPDGLARLHITGVMLHRPTDEELRTGAAPTEHLANIVRGMAFDSSVKAALLVFDSPGGQVTGTPELAAAVRALATVKPTVAFADGLMASAAYWVASQSGTIVAAPSSTLGSIGVYAAMFDFSKLYERIGIKVDVFKNAGADLKAMGLPGVPLTEPQRAHMQERVDAIFGEFSGAVTSMRPAVQLDSMRGQTFDARPALARGLVDSVGDMRAALALLGR